MRNQLVLAATLLVASAASAGVREVEHKFQSTAPRGQVQRVLIDIPYGNFTIRTGTSDRLALSGVASRDFDGVGDERASAQRIVNDTSAEIYINGAEAIVRRKFGKHADGWRARKFTAIDLRLDLPPGVDIAFDTTAGEVDVVGDFGDVSVDLRAGEVNVRVPRKSVRELNASCRIGEVRTNLGTEVVTKEGLFPGRTHFFNPAGKSHVNVHVTTGEVDVTLTQ
jgi:hypothetical protein